MSTPGPDLARRLVVERNLVRAAFELLTVDAFMALPFEALGPTKGLLKRFFSSEPWTPADDEALADAVGPGEGRWQHDLDGDVVLEYGWTDGRFSIALRADAPAGADGQVPTVDPLAATFDGPVVPEATPNPRTIRFQVGPIHDGPSRWFESAPAVSDDEPGVARLFAEFDEVANVLVGAEFVAVGLRRAADWERLLRPVLAVVTEEFAPSEAPVDTARPRVKGGPAGAGVSGGEDGPGSGAPDTRRVTKLEQAWRDLGHLRPADAGDVVAVQRAAAGEEPAHRQVAANLLREADPEIAAAAWSRLIADPVRSVRRAVVDAMVDVGREELRPLLEGALGDRDPWIRWKALRGLVELGPDASRSAIAAHADDPDFHVRLEAAAALRRGDPPPGVEEPSSGGAG